MATQFGVNYKQVYEILLPKNGTIPNLATISTDGLAVAIPYSLNDYVKVNFLFISDFIVGVQECSSVVENENELESCLVLLSNQSSVRVVGVNYIDFSDVLFPSL